ncbi:unnamed protein product [Rotaria magnacalcarata]|uniref:Uncharacterized protein n=1 Tax=Rotaria magnacalcarata TaxID=392030 RepID=A0A816CVA4_9BILA|nr:unnamed protein product [Rotaria magnacalcarata]CAF2046036.1 unnamed protein product [Rotaria magnacalcarata]CAF2226546.1 unnamed protein product [Rotaria magnacalcarata]CAF3904413.1 unnamed protein product [Rotaria magnacalcarata]CAF4070694.1 unnamed protein product [Rotaria magnacalcarata]
MKCFITDQKVSVDPPYVAEYFHLVSTIDKPIHLKKYYGMHESSIDFYPGTMNIILSVPHDGNIPSNLPRRPTSACRKLNSTNRKCYYQNPCVSPLFKIDPKNCRIHHGRDQNTRLLALALRYELNQLFRLKPFVIINRLERTKVDMNRFIDEGTFGASNTMHAWMRYHFYLRHARELIMNHKDNYREKGLLFDIHSQDHEHGLVELGYMLTSRQLSTNIYSLKGSSLASYLGTRFNPIDLISGNKSLGYFITKYKYSSTPSPTFPSPPNDSYFEWGYTIEEYGRYNNFSAIMIESPSRELVNRTKLYNYARTLAIALHDYLIEIELLESLIIHENINQTTINKQCNYSRKLNVQINLFMLPFIHVLNLI